MEQLWLVLSYLGTAFAGSFFGWLFSRKKEKVELEGSKVQNFDAAIEAYKKMYEDMIDGLKTQVADLKEENVSLKEELSENRKQIITLTNFVLASAILKGEEGVNLDALRAIVK